MNRFRSRTAEHLLKGHQGITVRSAGVSEQAVRQVSTDDLIWADLIVLMEEFHQMEFLLTFADIHNSLKVGCICLS